MNVGTRPAAAAHWVVLLAGPIAGTAYFFVVYLLAEASCGESVRLLSTAALRTFTIAAGAATAIGLLACMEWARRLWRADEANHAGSELAAERRDNGRFMALAALVLLGMFVVFVVFLAAGSSGDRLC